MCYDTQTLEGLTMKRTFSASESDIIFNMDYKIECIDFQAVADWLESITGKDTTAEDVEREFNARC
jgi:hypothetical protein